MEPVGMTNASAMKALNNNAKMNATAKLSMVSRTTCNSLVGAITVVGAASVIDGFWNRVFVRIVATWNRSSITN